MPGDVSWKEEVVVREPRCCLHSFGRNNRCDLGRELLTSVEDRITGAEEINAEGQGAGGSPLS